MLGAPAAPGIAAAGGILLGAIAGLTHAGPTRLHLALVRAAIRGRLVAVITLLVRVDVAISAGRRGDERWARRCRTSRSRAGKLRSSRPRLRRCRRRRAPGSGALRHRSSSGPRDAGLAAAGPAALHARWQRSRPRLGVARRRSPPGGPRSRLHTGGAGYR